MKALFARTAAASIIAALALTPLACQGGNLNISLTEVVQAANAALDLLERYESITAETELTPAERAAEMELQLAYLESLISILTNAGRDVGLLKARQSAALSALEAFKSEHNLNGATD